MTRNPDDSGPGDAPGFRARRATRVDLSDVEASLNDVYKVEIRVRNVSTAGFMAECAAPVRIGAYVTLEIPGIGPVEAQVRWQIGLKMGGRFLDPISLGRCEWTAEKTKAPAAA